MWTKRIFVPRKSVPCQQKKFIVHRKSNLCRQKQDNAAQKNILRSRIVINFSPKRRAI